MSTITIAVAGSGGPNPDLIADALRDAFPRTEDYPYRLLVPAVEERLTSGVQAVIEYGWDAEWTVVAVLERPEFSGLVGDLVADGADSTIVAGPGEVNNTIVAELALDLPNAYLVVMTQDGVLDPETLGLARECANAGLPVLDLSEGLIDIGGDVGDEQDWENEGGAVEPVVNDPAPLEDAPEDDAESDEEASPPTHVVVGMTEWRRIEKSLREVYASAAAIESYMAAASGETTLQPRPHTPSRRRHTRTEYWDEAAGVWRPRGRGRLKANIPTRTVPVG